VFAHNHWLRYHWEGFLKLVGHLQDVPRAEAWPQPEEAANEPPPVLSGPEGAQIIELPRAEILPGHFDLTNRAGGLPELSWKKRLPTGKTPPALRSPGTVTTLCLHQMAVRFGTTRSRRVFWAKEARKLPLAVQDMYQFAHLGVLMDQKALEAWAARRALHERMCGIPYHYASLFNGDRLKINPTRWYTYHGNGANKRSLGLAVEGHFPGLEKSRTSKHDFLDPDFMIPTCRGMITLAMMESKRDGMPVTAITAHRVFSGGRVADPGEQIWEEVVLWAIKEYGLKVDYELKVGSGLPVPYEWDESALFDYRGRRIKTVRAAA
jgi:hypothetical protein